jgi:hypothetical protein
MMFGDWTDQDTQEAFGNTRRPIVEFHVAIPRSNHSISHLQRSFILLGNIARFGGSCFHRITLQHPYPQRRF